MLRRHGVGGTPVTKLLQCNIKELGTVFKSRGSRPVLSLPVADPPEGSQSALAVGQMLPKAFGHLVGLGGIGEVIEVFAVRSHQIDDVGVFHRISGR